MTRGVTMRWTGVALAVFGVWFMRLWWYDPTEGPAGRTFAAAAIIGGVVLFFEGLKREIVSEVRRKDRDTSDS